MTKSIDFQFTYEMPDGTDLEIDCTAYLGRPEQGPTYASGGEPAEDDEITINEILIHDQEFDPDDLWLQMTRPGNKLGGDREIYYIQMSDHIVEKAHDALTDQSTDD